MILTAIDNDGLNNPSGFLHWLDSAADSVRGFADSHWARYVSDLANVAGAIATVCGVIALVLAFIPGMQEFAAAFETVALLAQAVAFCCHAAAVRHRARVLLDVAVDAVGLVTFGVGKGLIGGAEATAEISETAASRTRRWRETGRSGRRHRGRRTAAKDRQGRGSVYMVAKTMDQVKEVVSVRPVFSAAMKAWQDGKFGAALGEDAAGMLWRGLNPRGHGQRGDRLGAEQGRGGREWHAVRQGRDLGDDVADRELPGTVPDHPGHRRGRRPGRQAGPGAALLPRAPARL